MTIWGVAGRPLPGESASGDDYFAVSAEGHCLLAVVDGLGHGPEAAEASAKAVAHIESRSDMHVEDLVLGCHEAVRRTRGVVLALARIDEKRDTMTWVCVGNIDGRIVRADESAGKEALVQRGGVVGYQLPKLYPRTLGLSVGDTIVLATDGVRSGYIDDVNGAPVQATADRLIARHAKPTDDALVLVARYERAPT